MADCAHKGRAGRRKLTEGQAREIKLRMVAGEGNARLSRDYNLSISILRQIRGGKSYAWVETEP